MILVLLYLAQVCQAAVPVVCWHGVNGHASDCDGTINTIREAIPEVHVLNVEIGPDSDMDQANSIMMRCVDQIDNVCRQIQADPLMADGYNAVGLSQGGLLIRGLVQRCPVPVKNLITFGSPHQGVYGVPDCEQETGSYELCVMVRELLSAGAYVPWIQDLVAPAQYWHDPLNQTNFVQGSHYLAKVNNEGEKVAQYKDRMVSLDNFVMIKWNDDTTIIPKESSHFEFYHLGQENTVSPLVESQLYQEDWIGLRTMDEANKLHFFTIPGNHMDFNYDWVADNIVPFLL